MAADTGKYICYPLWSHQGGTAKVANLTAEDCRWHRKPARRRLRKSLGMHAGSHDLERVVAMRRDSIYCDADDEQAIG
jgi:hypothetical protein